MANITQRVRGGVLSTTFLPLAQWPGFTEGRIDRPSPEWPQAEAQASMKGSKAGSAAREKSVARRRGSRGTGASRFTAPRHPGVPRAASGSSPWRRCTCGRPPGSPSSSPPSPSPSVSGWRGQGRISVTPDFRRKTECISRVRQDHFTHT
jgi:hypothetical protein